eukprot:s408_g35.t4
MNVRYWDDNNELGRAHWTIALQLLEDLQRSSHQPDVVCCTAAINACEKGQQWPLALQLLHDIERSDTPNVVAYGAAISACRRSVMGGKYGLRWSNNV